MPIENYQGNSKADRAESEAKPEKKIEKVTENPVIMRKTPWHKRVLQTFVGANDAQGVANYILRDVIVPRFQDLVVDAVSTSIERAVFGEESARRPRPRTSINGTYTNYNGIAPRSALRQDIRPDISHRARATHDFGEIVLGTRGEADRVISQMYDALSHYDIVTVADLYELVGAKSGFTDTQFGWTGPGALNGARAVGIKNGYLLDLPRPVSIN